MGIAELKSQIPELLADARAQLLGQLGPDGYWEGRLSSSALATAVAVFALSRVNRETHADRIRNGLTWIARNRNSDGGWGDSPQSQSNLSTTFLCWAALSLAPEDDATFVEAIAAAESWLSERVGALEPTHIADAIVRYYGEDRTFSAPILTMGALAGRLGPEPGAWELVPQLPFEMAVLPHRLLKSLQLPVVSYAIPALIAIGLVRHHCGPAPGGAAGACRKVVEPWALRVLRRMQPDNGGFLEAPPLVSFVVMSLAASGYAEHDVTRKGADFLVSAMREDGSWAIDSNLSTWLTSLAVRAFGAGSGDDNPHLVDHASQVRQWLLKQQFEREHPFTHAAPGGWGWTDLPGAVPDADDTAGALLALRRLGPIDDTTVAAATAGVRWLLNLQNRDGGMPTFCRGWGFLPFDRSCPDITAHAIWAYAEWYSTVPVRVRARVEKGMRRAIQYLDDTVREDGAWVPLWFGNQHAPENANPTYATARVLMGLQGTAARGFPCLDPLAINGEKWLLDVQNDDGGWGGDRGVPSSFEETALAVAALIALDSDDADGVWGGLAWLHEHARDTGALPTSPIGLYFASLWYDEELYPLIFLVSALARAEWHGFVQPIEDE